jgi:hypothetical protein
LDRNIELTRDEFEPVYEAIRKPTTKFEREDVVDIVRTERKARLLLKQISHRVGLRETVSADGEFRTS